SPFTQRALHQADNAIVHPAVERRVDLLDVDLGPEEDGDRAVVEIPADLVPPVDRVPDLVWQPDDVRRVAEEEGLAPIALEGVTELDPFPQAQPHAFEAQRPAIAARG